MYLRGESFSDFELERHADAVARLQRCEAHSVRGAQWRESGEQADKDD